MTAEQIAGLVLALLAMVTGMIGAVLPILPGAPIILAAAVGHKLYFGGSSANWWVIAVLMVLVALSYAFDYAAQALGTRKLGGTWRGIAGAMTGGFVGIFFSIPGMLIGPFVGAFLFELIGGRQVKLALRAGTGAVLGLAVGAAGKVALCVAMIVLFCASVIWNS